MVFVLTFKVGRHLDVRCAGSLTPRFERVCVHEVPRLCTLWSLLGSFMQSLLRAKLMVGSCWGL